ncbi:capsid cement protein [Flexibacterium corallicola]|uniref:capsid cement protein n=1 Tax=Flexibacterium corallicola TaxID=3037259 RepID=UPI00286F6414|nr:capsid cement protein [Pseudovibrio sp. M1P-2-3]
MHSFGLVKNFTAEGDIPKRRLVTHGTSEGHVMLASVGSRILGTTGIAGAMMGERVDVCLDSVREVEYGGDIAFDDLLTSDAEGRAIKADPAANTHVYVIGTAMCSGGVGAIGNVLIRPFELAG